MNVKFLQLLNSHGDESRPQHRAGEIATATLRVGSLLGAKFVAVLLALVSVVVVATSVLVIIVVAASGVSASGSLHTISEIPPIAATAYTVAATAAQAELGCTISPAVVAAIGWAESRHGSGRLDGYGDASPPIIGIALDGVSTALIFDTDNGRLDGDTTYDRAVGPTQFLPATWASWGQDGNADGIVNPQNITDAAKATAWYLCLRTSTDLSDPTTLSQAILRYNRSQQYLAKVLAKAAEYQALMAAPGVGGDPTALLAHPGFTGSQRAVADLESGQVDPRLISILYNLASQQPIYVGTIKTGHYQCVGGGSLEANPTTCKESHHWHWRGADISIVSQAPVSSQNYSAYSLVNHMATLPVDSPLRPAEVGSPWPQFNPLGGFFHDEDHLDHLHLAVCGPRIRYGVVVDNC